jgi:DeoR family transcriptional regulator of aga operon/DeoR family fructose operon transcriptional repressor
LSVGELADRFAVSVVTIRKDLDDLASEGLLERTFGGAVFTNRSRFNKSFLERARQHSQQKRAIARAALEYIQDGDTIILDAGTTVLTLAQLLKEQIKSAFIITCSVPAALELSTAGYDILLLGGMVRNKSLALLGRETLTILERYRADKAFLGSSGFTAEVGHSTPNPEDAQIKEAIIRASVQRYVLVDSSKYGHNCLTSFTRLRDVDLTITDSQLARSKQKALENAGANLRIADLAATALNNAAENPAAILNAAQTATRNNVKKVGSGASRGQL